MKLDVELEKLQLLHDVCSSSILPIERVARLLRLFTTEQATLIFHCIPNFVVCNKDTLAASLVAIADHMRVDVKFVAAQVHAKTEVPKTGFSRLGVDPWDYHVPNA